MKTIKAVWGCKHWFSGDKLLTRFRVTRYIEREEWAVLCSEKQLCPAMKPKCPDCGLRMELIT